MKDWDKLIYRVLNGNETLWSQYFVWYIGTLPVTDQALDEQIILLNSVLCEAPGQTA